MTFNSEPSDGFCRCAYGKQCPKGSQCLRSQAWEQPEESALQAVALRMVNIKCEKIKIMTDECSMFVSNQKKRIAIGITHLLYNVPYKNISAVKREVYESLGSRTTFIRCQKQEHPISPEEQTAIAREFAKYELGEPQYDRFEDVYNW